MIEPRIDALTGVSCRRDANNRLADEFRIARQLAMPLSVCLIDINRFKQVNDTCGHARGDDARRQVARLLALGLRSDDYLARFGGEEFIVMLPNTRAELARQIAERLKRAVEEGPWFAPARLTVSIGLATSEPQCTLIGELIEAADTALYQARNLCRNRVESATPAADAAA